MTNKECLEALMPELVALPESKAKRPTMPVEEFIQKAETICALAVKDKDALVKAKLAADKIDKLPKVIGALRELFSNWGNVHFNEPESRKLWKIKIDEADAVRFELQSAMYLAFRDDVNLQYKLSRILEGGSNADKIQDLNDFAVLGRENLALLTSVTDFDPGLLEKAAALSTELGNLLAKSTIDKSKSPEVMLLRDKTYGMLNDMLTDVIAYAKRAFRNDSKKAQLYNISYSPHRSKQQTPEAEQAS